MFATGEAVYDDRGSPNGTMYGMVQCMRDRTASECALCLWNSTEQLEIRNRGGEMLGYNCYLRVEFYAFYNLSLSAVPTPPPLAPAPSSFMPTVGERNRNGGSVGVIAGVGGGFAALLLGVVLYIIFYRRRKAKKAAVLPFSEDSILHATTSSVDKIALSSSQADKSVEFSYEELFNATEGFSISNEIGKGGFGVVYYAEIRGEKAAIKKMDVQATHEFLAELNVLTHVYHLNLVRLIGYCVERYLFIVYEYIENGNLRQHLCGTGYEPLSWAARVQIALDSARGLQYIHEHTVPVYIHRDIKSANILIDKNNRAKVADFGLTKLAEVGNASLPTRGIVGTFGYMPPEYAQYGDVSRKVDVFAFGVVLYELISAKEAIVRSTEPGSDSMGLVYLFEEALNAQDPKEGLRRLIDPALGLGEHYPMDSILKMTVLARACTQEDPESRPTMRSVVVALMTLSFMDEGVME
ncbi:chitin elicitor receptor kinase 1-like isoform X2 [Panicum virgatum]|uniref:chitin elicitor receptor kinase 1-like isoform X2 n=1 Tax=Panicum virgatum TaxID=38727 RepID=UPI0019D68182|nr:chitin elicitor receptor kinase 1-like isoform X2 [Panicum virgatum]